MAAIWRTVNPSAALIKIKSVADRPTQEIAATCASLLLCPNAPIRDTSAQLSRFPFPSRLTASFTPSSVQSQSSSRALISFVPLLPREAAPGLCHTGREPSTIIRLISTRRKGSTLSIKNDLLPGKLLQRALLLLFGLLSGNPTRMQRPFIVLLPLLRLPRL